MPVSAGLTEGEQPQALLKARTASVLDLVKQLSEVTAATVALEEARPPAPKTVSVVRMGSGEIVNRLAFVCNPYVATSMLVHTCACPVVHNAAGWCCTRSNTRLKTGLR